MSKEQIEQLMKDSEKRVEASNNEVKQISKNVETIIKKLNKVL